MIPSPPHFHTPKENATRLKWRDELTMGSSCVVFFALVHLGGPLARAHQGRSIQNLESDLTTNAVIGALTGVCMAFFFLYQKRGRLKDFQHANVSVNSGQLCIHSDAGLKVTNFDLSKVKKVTLYHTPTGELRKIRLNQTFFRDARIADLQQMDLLLQHIQESLPTNTPI